MIDDITDLEQRLTPTEPTLIEQALDGDPESIQRLQRRREAVEHIVQARRLLREAHE